MFLKCSFQVNINPAYVDRELEYCINKVECKGIILSQSVKAIESFSILCRLVPELDQYSISHKLSSKSLPTLKHIILTGRISSMSGVHSYEDLIQRGATLSRKKINERQASVNPDAPVAIYYTSGTTGQPKAATLTNFAMLNLARAQWKHLGRFFTRLCVPIPIFHVFGEVVGVLNAAVAKCQIIFPSILPDTISTMQSIHEEKCTAIIGAPIIFRDILTNSLRSEFDLSSLAFAILGASPIRPDFLRQLEVEIPIGRVAQGYGMTETTAILTSAMWAGDDDQKRRHGSLGKCMQGLEVKIVDSQGNSVPIGQQGEIWARGYSMMLEYYADSEKTQEILTSSDWLRTGDEAIMDDDGYLYYVGRKKEIIIRGGINIYPIEVENAISQHPNIAEVQVFSIPDERYGEEVCAWIKLKSNASPCTADDIIKFLQNKLAFFKIPKHIRFVDKFIMTSTGKVQKFKLSQIMINELKQTDRKSFMRPIDISESLDTNISFYCDFECENLTNDMICQALSLLRQHHPYFRLHAETIDEKVWLVEKESGDLPLIWLEGITENWQDELVQFANQSRDHTVSLTFLQCRYNMQGRYQLFGVINHIALDGLGFINALHTFYSYIGEMSVCTDYKTVPLADRRAFINVFARNPVIQPSVFNFNHDYLPPQECNLDEDDSQPNISSSKAQMLGLFEKFDQETTSKLLAYAKAHSTTIQGMLSTAALIISIWIRKVRPQFPIWAMNWCVTNLRTSAQPAIDPKDCVFACAPLAWEQKVDEDLSIWSLAQEASNQLHKHNSQYMGWYFLDVKRYGISVKPPSVIASSSGKLNLATSYAKVKITDLRVMTAHYDYLTNDTSSHITYSYIYDEQLNLVNMFSYPGLGKQWGKRFHIGITYILNCFANDLNRTVGCILKALDNKDEHMQFFPV